MESPTPFRLPHRASALGLVLLLLLTLAALTAPTAWAHDTLVSSTPADGETLETAPTELVLTFNATPADIGLEVVVAGPDGADATAGAATIREMSVAVPLSASLPNGDYAVTWRVTSSDGHPISGDLTFAVAEPDVPTPDPSPTSAEATTPAASAAPAPEAASPSVVYPGPGVPVRMPRWALGVFAVGAAATVVTGVIRLRRMRER